MFQQGRLTLHHQKMIVLGLIATGRRYGFEIEEFVSRTEMRRWAQIGSSTIYKILRDLEKEGAVESRSNQSGRGPVRNEYELTQQGRHRLSGYILTSLKSDATSRFDRIAGLFFSPLLGKKEARSAIADTEAVLSNVIERLEEHLRQEQGDVIAEAIIEFYIDIFLAEQKAARKVLIMFK